ncbi:MAG: excinuclease ABC subunit UvrC [Bacilli bacterium]|nr:excinuclease ABC subunit UvrC [Bacilli bacterium]
MEKIEYIKEKLKLVPTKPGSYQMKNKDGIIIYVGKAKNLKNRLKSYFIQNQTGKTKMLVNDIDDFEYIVTTTELESLILEITLIKKYNPKYNILLKDDKSYPYIELTNEKFPRLKIVRNINRKKNKNRLFGPYPNVTAARKTVNIINRIYPLRKCEILKKDLCLYYHINECLGYCKKDIDESIIDNMNNEIISFLKGNNKNIIEKLEEKMNKASDSLNFEKALEYKNMLEDINITLIKQKISIDTKHNFDLFAYYTNNNFISIQVFYIREGLLFGKHNDIIQAVNDKEEILTEYIIKFYERNNIIPNTIIVPEIDNELLSEYLKTKVLVPKKGLLKNLYKMAEDNAKILLEEKEETIEKDDLKREEAINELKNILNIPASNVIEAFDNSHLFGTFYVGGMVSFTDFKPNKDNYRKYKLDVNTTNDLDAMKELIYRRYYKVLMENIPLPDIILIDGGELQVKIAKNIIDSLNLNIKIIGLKKDSKHKTNSIIDDNLNTINIDSHSNLFLFLSRIQEEVHNYAITYHRNIKSKGSLATTLNMVEGIGKIREKELLKKFGSLKKIKEASLEELEKVLPKETALKLYNYLKALDK